MQLMDDSRQPTPTENSRRATNGGQRMQVLLFRVGEQAYGLPLSCVEQFTFMAELTRPAEAPSLLAGFLNLQGQIIGVVHLARLLDLPATWPELYTPLLIIRDGDERFGLLVTNVDRVVAIRDSQILPMECDQSLHGCVSGIIEQAEEFIGLLVPQRLLLEKERQWIRGLAQLEARRLGELEALLT